MASKLWFTRFAGPPQYQSRQWYTAGFSSTLPGLSTTSQVVNTVAGPTSGVLIQDFMTDPLGAVTISGTISFNLWGSESGMNANAGFDVGVYRCDSLGNIISTIVRSERGTEMATSAGLNAWTATPTSTTLVNGDRILVRVYINDAGGTMGSGFTATFSYDGPTNAANGDSWINFADTLPSARSLSSSKVLYPQAIGSFSLPDLDTAATELLVALASAGNPLTQYHTASIAGPTAGKQLTRGVAIDILSKTNPFSTDDVRGIAFGNSRHVAVGGDISTSRIAVSSDSGETWTNNSSHPFTGRIWSVHYNPFETRFVAFGVISGTQHVARSPVNPGSTWVACVSDPFTQPVGKLAVRESDGKLVGVDYGGQTGYSTDGGQNWTGTTDLNWTNGFVALKYGNGMWVVVGTGGVCYYSTDGTNWNSGTSLSNNPYDLDYNAETGVWMASGDFGIATTSDPTAGSWTVQDLSGSSLGSLVLSVAYDDTSNVWMASDNLAHVAISADDGVSWSDVTDPWSGNILLYTVAAPGASHRWVVGGQDGRIGASIADDPTWVEDEIVVFTRPLEGFTLAAGVRIEVKFNWGFTPALAAGTGDATTGGAANTSGIFLRLKIERVGRLGDFKETIGDFTYLLDIRQSGADVFFYTPSAVTFVPGDRFKITPYIDDLSYVSNMATGGLLTLGWGAGGTTYVFAFADNAAIGITELPELSPITADAVLRKTQAGSFTADAVIVSSGTSTETGSFTVDAVIKATRTSSLVADAVLRMAQAGSFTADAVIATATTVPGSFTADAVLRRTQSASLTSDAVLRTAQAASLTADAVLRVGRAGSFTADAVLSKWFTADAVLRATQAHSFTASAWIYAPRADPSGQGEPGETPLVSIIVGGVDVTRYVVIADATFTMLVNGAVGNFSFRVRDDDHVMNFTSGAEVTVDIDGKRRFGGYLMLPKRMFAFPVEDTTDPEHPSRFHVLTGTDYNILMTRRIVFDHANPANVELRHWPADSDADVVIKYIFDHYTDLGADGVTYNGVTNVGSPNPDKAGVVGSGGLSFADAMREINRLISGVFYIDAYKDLNYVDVDTPNAAFDLSDNPGPGELGYREFSHTENGTGLVNDAMVWGAGLGMQNGRLVFSRVEDATSIADHGRWQFGEYTNALFRQASVDKRADTIVNGTEQGKRGGKDPQESWHLISFNNTWEVGQKVQIESEVFDISDVVPIRRLTLTFVADKRPKFDLTLSHEIDEPWNLFEFWFPKFPPFDFNFDFDLSFDGTLPEPGDCDCGITDTFSREVAAGWGTSDALLPYEMFFSGAATNNFVTGGFASMIGDPDFQDPLATLNYPPEPDSTQEILVKLRFTDPELDGGNDANINFGVGPFGGRVYHIRLYGDGTVQARSDGGHGSIYLPSVDTSDWFWLRYEGSPTVFRYKIWQDGDTEPGTWEDENASAGFRGGRVEFETETRPFQTQDIRLDVDDLQVAGLDGCSAIQFDDFERGSPAGEGWGVATPSGIPWVIDSRSTRGHASVGSSAGYGRVYVLNGTFPNTQGGVQVSAPFPAGVAGDFTLRARARYTRVPQPPNGASCGYFLFATLADGRSISVDIQTQVAGAASTYVDFVLYDEDFNVISNDQTVVGTSWAENEWADITVVVTATTATLTVLVAGDSSPVVEAMLTDTGFTGSGARVGAAVNAISNDASATFALDVEFIDFDYDGRPCFCGGGAETIFDAFDRANTTGFEDWGTAPGGEVYSYAGMGLNNGAAYITGGVGQYSISAGSPEIFFGSYLPTGDQILGPWLKPQFTFTCKFKTPTWTYDGSDASIDGTGILMFTNQSREIYLTMGTLVDSELNVLGHGWIQTDDSAQQEFDWHPDTWYRVKWYYDLTSGDSWLKVWLDGDPEPDWMITDGTYAGMGGDIQGEYFSIRSSSFTGSGMPFDSTNPAVIGIDDLAFETCVDTAGGSGLATGGIGRGDDVATAGQTVFLVGQAYVPGTMRAFVGGYFQRPGIEFTETDPEAGEVTFASGLSAGALVSFFYEVQRV